MDFCMKMKLKNWLTDLHVQKAKKLSFQALLEKVTEVASPHGRAKAGPY